MLPSAGCEEILGSRSSAVSAVVVAVDGIYVAEDAATLRIVDAKMVGRREGRVVYVLDER